MNSDVASLNAAAVKNTATINFSCSTRGSQWMKNKFNVFQFQLSNMVYEK
jgi:hypothetical protein